MGRLFKLRQLMSTVELPGNSKVLGAYVVPTRDAHDNEYVGKCDARREFLSGFTGSAGTVVVTHKEALLWTDGRYFTQAENQLDKNEWKLMKDRLPDTPEIEEWLGVCTNMESPYVGIDPTLISFSSWKNWEKALSREGKCLIAIENNLVDSIRVEEYNPSVLARPEDAITAHDVEYAGETVQSKVERVREKLRAKKARLLVLTALDEVAWLLNLRGSDIPYNPVFYSYCIVTAAEVILFVDSCKLTESVLKHLSNVVSVKPYEDFLKYMRDVVCKDAGDADKIWVGPNCNYAIARLFDENRLLVKNTPVCSFKAVKNEREVEHMKACHVRDGVALCEYLMLVEEMVRCGEAVTEVSGAGMLDGLRSRQQLFVGLSFPTISSVGPSAAVIHYTPTEDTDRPLSNREIYLVDSGGQYLDGTTDVTRTLHFGNPTHFQRTCYTNVLKGHILLASQVIPSGTNGTRIDSLARSFLWNEGLDYQHGTGHGVGMFLNVHEGPCGIHFRRSENEEGIVENMILSNEPGYYHNGQFGIRIESLIVYRECKTPNNFGGQKFLKPETITFTPLARNLINRSLLSPAEIQWVNDYHAECLAKLQPLLESQGKTKVLQWLRDSCAPLQN